MGRAGADAGRESVDALVEAIGIIRRVWAGERGIDADGEHYRMHGAHGGPEPAHDIGIWLGAYGPRMVRIVGRLADGWVPSLPRLPLEEVPGRQDAIDEAARKAGRDPAKIRRVANLNGVIADGRSRAGCTARPSTGSRSSSSSRATCASTASWRGSTTRTSSGRPSGSRPRWRRAVRDALASG